MDLLDRYIGSMCGLAIGDSLGAAIEFYPSGRFSPITDLVGGGPHSLKPGEWTDDTSLALCLASSLIEKKKHDPMDQMQRYVRWCREGYMSSTGSCFDIGNTTLSSLNKFLVTGNPYSGSTDPQAAGNGSLMRLAPVPLFYAGNFEEAVMYSGESSRTTHGTVQAVDACRYYGALIAGAVNGEGKTRLLDGVYKPFPGSWDRYPLCDEIKMVVDGSFRIKNPPEIVGSGYVVRCLEASLWAFYNSDSYKDGALLAVNLGDDADTTGAVYGQLAGAYYGAQSIPKPWLEKLAYRELITEIATKLYENRV